MKYSVIPLCILLLSTMVVVSNNTLPDPGQNGSVISSIEVAPTVPLVNETVLFQVFLTQNSNISSVILNLEHNMFSVSTEMNESGVSIFSSSIIFNETGLVDYYVELYDSESNLVETSQTYSITVAGPGSGNIPVNFIYNISNSLHQGNYSLISPDQKINISLRIQKSAQLRINKVNNTSTDVPSGKFPVSDIFDININDTEALVEAELSLRYNLSQEFSHINEQTLIIYQRSNSSVSWEATNSSVNQENNIISVTTSSFSEWAILATDPTLRFVDFTSEYTTEINQYLDVISPVKNFGSYTAENISIRIVIPSGILLNNMSNTVYFDSLNALDQVTLTWNLYPEDYGSYSLVVIAESSNADGDIIEMRINVSQTSSNNSTSNTNQTPLKYNLFAIVMITVVIRQVRKR